MPKAAMAKPKSVVPDTIRILSIDGGGIRGILAARVLQVIEQTMGKSAANLFHLIAGTSTGGILGCGLLKGIKAKDLADLYASRGGDIFRHSLWQTVKTVENLTGPRYEADALEDILKAELGENVWLSQTTGAELLVPSYCIQLPRQVPLADGDVQSTRIPFLFKTWKARGTALDKGDVAEALDFRLWEVARATSAAPTYFPPAIIKNRRSEEYAMVDGGVFANNPAMCALSAARKLRRIFHQDKPTRFLVVSLGTGSLERSIDAQRAVGWGEIAWLHPILNILMDGNSDTVCYEADEELGADHIRFETSTGTDPHSDTFVNEDFDCATPDNIERIELLAKAFIEGSQDKIDKVCDMLAEPMSDPLVPAPEPALV